MSVEVLSQRRTCFTRFPSLRLKQDWAVLHGHLTCPITAFAGGGDTFVTVDDMWNWSLCSESFNLILVEGDHAFLTSAGKDICSTIISTVNHPDQGLQIPKTRSERTHLDVTWNGRAAVAKVQHPHVRDQYLADLQTMTYLGEYVNHHDEAKGAAVMLGALAEKLRPTVVAETDFTKEAENQHRLREALWGIAAVPEAGVSMVWF